MQEDFTKHISEEITEEIRKFVDNEVFKDEEYLFIEKINGANFGHCTKCHNEYQLSETYKHNQYGVCPVCGAKLQVKLSRYGRKNCFNDACFYYFEKSIVDVNVIICKGYYVSRDYTVSYKNPQTKYMLEAVYIFGDKVSKMLKLYYSNLFGGRWEEQKSVFDFNQGWLAPKMCYISPESMNKAIQGTRFQYIPKKLLKGYCSTVKVLNAFAKYPWLEQIYKMGFQNIVEAKIDGSLLYNCLNYKGKDIFKILRLSRKDVKDIVQSKEHITPLFLSLYRLQIKDKSHLSPAEVADIADSYGYDYGALKSILKHTTMKKAANYMDKQYKQFKKVLYYTGNVVTTWSDYIGDCLKLDMNLKDEHVIFPKNVYNAHQNTIRAIKVKESKELDAKIKRRLKPLKKYDFEFNGLMIRAAKSSIELIDEGRALHHCVATYVERYAKGQTNILVIRKMSEPNKPYFTLELRDNQVMQCYGNHDCIPKEDVKEFVDAFKKEKLSKKKEVNNIIRIPA